MSDTVVVDHVYDWEDSSHCLDTIPRTKKNGNEHSDDESIVIEVVTPESLNIQSVSFDACDSLPPNSEVVTDQSKNDEIVRDCIVAEEPPLRPSPSIKEGSVKKRLSKLPSTRIKRVLKSKSKAFKKNTRNENKAKSTELPSVYSRNQIARHTKMMNKLKELELNDETDSEASNEEVEESCDRDLDINLRIFEGSAESVDRVVIGEIQCNILDDKSTNEIIDNSNKNATNVFKLSVNTNFVDVCDTRKNKSQENSIENICIVEAEDDVDDPLYLSDNDSDLEILVSKPIIRKRASQVAKKEKPAEKKQKLTMYDLIHDNVYLSSDSKTDESEGEQKEDKNKESMKSKIVSKKPKAKKEEPKENVKQITESKEEKNQNLPVPKLKVGADGEVIIDMDSLVIEQTGVTEARNALANSEVVEECALSFTSYSKRNSFRKQWSPHETLKFYKVLSTVGTDFTLMATLFPSRTRKCMKRKFKKEEKTSPELIMKALSCKQNFNIDVLEKELQLKDDKLNQFKENTRKQKLAQKKIEREAIKKDKEKEKIKRKSFFQTSISRFQKN